MNPSHVYTYHVECFRPGGGLYLFTPGKDGGELKKLVSSPKKVWGFAKVEKDRSANFRVPAGLPIPLFLRVLMVEVFEQQLHRVADPPRRPIVYVA